MVFDFMMLVSYLVPIYKLLRKVILGHSNLNTEHEKYTPSFVLNGNTKQEQK